MKNHKEGGSEGMNRNEYKKSIMNEGQLHLLPPFTYQPTAVPYAPTSKEYPF